MLPPAVCGSSAASRHQGSHDLPGNNKVSLARPSASLDPDLNNLPVAKKGRLENQGNVLGDMVVGGDGGAQGRNGVEKGGSPAAKRRKAKGGKGGKGGPSSSTTSTTTTPPTSSLLPTSASSSASRTRVESGNDLVSSRCDRNSVQSTDSRKNLWASQPQDFRDRAVSSPSRESTAASSTAILAQVLLPPGVPQKEKGDTEPGKNTRARRRERVEQLAKTKGDTDPTATSSSSASGYSSCS